MIATAQTQPNCRQTDESSLNSLPVYGECVEVFSTDDFLKHVTVMDPRITVVVHLYDPLIRACQTLNNHLALLSRDWIHIKFLLMNIDISEINIDRVALPALSLYR